MADQAKAAEPPKVESVSSDAEVNKCNRCDRAIRQFEDTIRCSNLINCLRVYHRRCVLPNAASDLIDDKWRCDQCDVILLKPADSVVFKQRVSSSPRRAAVDDTYEYRFKDGRTHICKNPHCPQMRGYSKVKSASSLVSDYDSYKYYTYQPKVETVVSEAQNYKTYSYVEPHVDVVPAHVERVEITEIAQGIDERIRYKEPVVEKIVEKIVEVKRPVIEHVVETKKPVVEQRVFTHHPHEVYTYAVVDDSVVHEHPNEYFYYATDDDRRVEVVREVREVECGCDHHCQYHQPLHYKSPKLHHKSALSFDIPLTVQVPSKKFTASTSKLVQVSSEEERLKKLYEKRLFDQESTIRAKERKIGELEMELKSKQTLHTLPSVKVTRPKQVTTTSTSTNTSTDIFTLARDESIRDGNEWITSLIDEVSKITTKYPLVEEEFPENNDGNDSQAIVEQKRDDEIKNVSNLTNLVLNIKQTKHVSVKDDDEVKRVENLSKLILNMKKSPDLERRDEGQSVNTVSNLASLVVNMKQTPVSDKVSEPVKSVDNLSKLVLNMKQGPDSERQDEGQSVKTVSNLASLVVNMKQTPVSGKKDEEDATSVEHLANLVLNMKQKPVSDKPPELHVHEKEMNIKSVSNLANLVVNIKQQSDGSQNMTEQPEQDSNPVSNLINLIGTMKPNVESTEAKTQGLVEKASNVQANSVSNLANLVLNMKKSPSVLEEHDSESETRRQVSNLSALVSNMKQKPAVVINDKLELKQRLQTSVAENVLENLLSKRQAPVSKKQSVEQDPIVVVEENAAPSEKLISAIQVLVDDLKGGSIKVQKPQEPKVSVAPAKSVDVLSSSALHAPAPKSIIVENGYDSLNSKKGRDLTRSEMNLRFDDSHLDGRNTISSRISDKYYADSYRTGSLERSSSSALAYDTNRSRDGIYEYVKPIAPSAILKASFKGYLERIRLDKILFISEKIYCVIDGCLMHCYKKPTDKKQIKSYKLTGVIVKTPEDYQHLSLGAKKPVKNLKHPRSFEVRWKNGKVYQFVVPKNEDFSQWVYALKAASAIDHQLSYNPTEKFNGYEM